MNLTDVMIDFKKERTKFRKIPLNVSVNVDRLRIFDNAMGEKSQFYHIMNRSEQMDFLLYILERFLRNSPEFNLEELTYSKITQKSEKFSN